MKKIFSTRYSDLSFNFSMLLIRLAFGGYLFLSHGMMKLNNFSEWKDGFSDPFHVGHSTSLMMAIFAEIFCSSLLVLGLLTRLAAFVLVIFFLTLVFIIKKGQPIQKMELDMLYLAVSVTILLCGPGNWSVDRLIGK